MRQTLKNNFLKGTLLASLKKSPEMDQDKIFSDSKKDKMGDTSPFYRFGSEKQQLGGPKWKKSKKN